jgi:hypothetical protein
MLLIDAVLMNADADAMLTRGKTEARRRLF